MKSFKASVTVEVVTPVVPDLWTSKFFDVAVDSIRYSNLGSL